MRVAATMTAAVVAATMAVGVANRTLTPRGRRGRQHDRKALCAPS